MHSFIRFLICTLFLLIRRSRSDPSHILPCFQSYPAGTAQPITTIYGTSLYDCLKTCLQWSGNYGDNCASVLWDDYQHSCYLFNQRASQNPGILLNRYGTTYYEKIGYTCGGAPTVGPTSAPSITSCPNKASTAYFTVAEAELATSSQSGTTTLSEVPAENACISSCTDEVGPGGATLPCTGLTALPKANRCVVATTKAEPTGNGILVSNPDAVYFEKFCLPATAPPDCFEQFFFLFPRKTLAGHDITSSPATSLADCAAHCIENARCQSAVFDSSSGTCTLKDESAITHPSDFVNGHDTDYYFEDGCLIPGNRSSLAAAGAGRSAAALSRLRSRLRLLALTSSSSERKGEVISTGKGKASGEKNSVGLSQTWGLWSACQFQVGSRRARVRVRNCSSLTKCPDKDIEFDFCST